MIIAYFANALVSTTKRSKTHIVDGQHPLCNSRVEGLVQFVAAFDGKNMPECGNCRASWKRREELYSQRIDRYTSGK